MKKIPRGKGWYIWLVKNTMGGDPVKLAAEAKKQRLGHVLFHIHDGYLAATQLNGEGDLTPYITEMKKVGIECWGWGAVYRGTWSAGADRVIEAFKKYPDLVGYVIDAENGMSNSPKEAEALMNKLRAALPYLPIGLSSYRYPSYHMDLPWSAFRNYCDFDMPQVYWEQSTNAGYQLQKSYKEFQNMFPKLPYIPTGAAYKVGTWKPTTSQVKEFLDTAKALALPGANMWVWYQAQRDLPDVYAFFSSYYWNPEVILEITLEEKVKKLWDAHPDLW